MVCPFCSAAHLDGAAVDNGGRRDGDGARTRVLVVDDDDDLSRVLQVHLEGEGYEVALASDGEGALRQAASLPPHAIVLDIVLPDRSGIEVCRDLRKLSSTSLVPILFLTGKGFRQEST